LRVRQAPPIRIKPDVLEYLHNVVLLDQLHQYGGIQILLAGDACGMTRRQRSQRLADCLLFLWRQPHTP